MSVLVHRVAGMEFRAAMLQGRVWGLLIVRVSGAQMEEEISVQPAEEAEEDSTGEF